MYSNILLPVDVEAPAKVENAFRLAEQLLASEGKISVVNVIEDIPGYVEAQLPKEILADRLQNAIEALDECIAEAGIAAEHHVLYGHVANTILEYAEKNENDLIIVSSHKPELSDYLLGSTAARLVRNAKCSVLVIR